MPIIFEPNPDRTRSDDTSRAWGDLTVKLYGGSTILTVNLWPDGRHVLKVPENRSNFGALVTCDILVDLAVVIDAFETRCAKLDELGRPLPPVTVPWPAPEG